MKLIGTETVLTNTHKNGRYMGQDKAEMSVYQRDNRTFYILVNGEEKTVGRGRGGFIFDRRITTQKDGTTTVTGKGENQDEFIKAVEDHIASIELEHE